MQKLATSRRSAFRDGTVRYASVLTGVAFIIAVANPGMARGEYQQGKLLNPNEPVQSIKITITTALPLKGQGAVACDLGLGFPLWLHAGERQDERVEFGAAAQEMTNFAEQAGSSTEFVFRVDGPHGTDVLGTSSALLRNSRFADFSRVAFYGTKQSALKAYRIEVNGKLLAANDAVPENAGPNKLAESVPVKNSETLRRQIADLESLIASGLASDADVAELKQLRNRIAPSGNGQPADVLPGVQLLYLEPAWKSIGRIGNELKSVKVTVWTNQETDSPIEDFIYLGVGGHKYLLFGPRRPLRSSSAPQTVEVDLTAGGLVASDLRGFSLGRLASSRRALRPRTECRLRRWIVEVEGIENYDSDSNPIDRKSLAIVRLVPPVPAASAGQIFGTGSAGNDQISLWSPGEAAGLVVGNGGAAPLTPGNPTLPNSPAGGKVPVQGWVVYRDALSPTGYRGLPDATLDWRLLSNGGQSTVSRSTQNGSYQLQLPTGTYEVTVSVPSNWTAPENRSVVVAANLRPVFFEVSSKPVEPVPQPEPIPQPQPIPQPIPEPQPIPDVTPQPMPIPGPTPAPVDLVQLVVVVTSEFKPLAGVSITAQLARKRVSRQAVTDKAGRCVLFLPAGTVRITATKVGYVDGVQSVELQPPGAMVGIMLDKIPIPPFATDVPITIRVMQRGQPLDGARVSITGAADASPEGTGAYTARLRPGQYQARVTSGRLGKNITISVGKQPLTLTVELTGSAGPTPGKPTPEKPVVVPAVPKPSVTPLVPGGTKPLIPNKPPHKPPAKTRGS